jgi:hypothetical protein
MNTDEDEEFDLSRFTEKERWKIILKDKNLAVNRRFLRLAHASGRLWKALGNSFPAVMRFQERVYDRVYNRLDGMQKRLDVCGWKIKEEGRREKEAGSKGTKTIVVCRRAKRQCCRYADKCEYLDYGGCPVRSICCKLWLCREAVEYLAALKADRNSPLHGLAMRYIRARKRGEWLCRALAIPLKGRCSREDAFYGDDGPDAPRSMNAYMDRWYDGALLRPAGVFISRAALEREVPVRL